MWKIGEEQAEFRVHDDENDEKTSKSRCWSPRERCMHEGSTKSWCTKMVALKLWQLDQVVASTTQGEEREKDYSTSCGHNMSRTHRSCARCAQDSYCGGRADGWLGAT